ncbi:hypothetical protein BDW22DRAFT_56368 [Trametopsis cervina]|nr:hypothetical protein BDW22DRAFT_56368 [Trametopsis cervina]
MSHPSVLVYPPMHPAHHAPYMFSALPEYHGPPLPAGEPLPKTPTDRTSDWISEQQKIPYTPGPPQASPILEGAKDQIDCLSAMMPLDNEQALPQPQREAFYQSLSEVLPPACGIEESVGTYKAYMTQQVQGYYDKLVSGSVPFSGYDLSPYSLVPEPKVASSQPVYASVPPPLFSVPYPPQMYRAPVPQPPASVYRTAIKGNGEFSNWVLYGGRSQDARFAPSPSQTPSLSETATTMSSTLWPSDSLHGHSRNRSSPTSLEMSDILQSPVLKSRQNTNDSFYTAPADDSEYFKNLFPSPRQHEASPFLGVHLVTEPIGGTHLSQSRLLSSKENSREGGTTKDIFVPSS